MSTRPAADGYQRVIINVFYLLAAQHVGLLARFVLVVAAAIYLGPALYGLFQVASAWYLAMLPLAGGGMQFILSREIGRNAEIGRQIVFPALLVRLALALSTATVCFFSGWLFDDGDGFRVLLGVLALALIGRSIALWANAVFTAHQSSRYNFILQLIFRIAEAAAALLTLSAGYGVVALAFVHAISWWMQALAGLWVLHYRFGELRPVWQPSVMMRLFLSGIPLALVLFLITWQLQGPLVLFKQLLPDADEIGRLALTFQIFLTLGSLAWVVGNACLPALSATKDVAAIRQRFLSLIMRIGILAGAIFALTGWAFGKSIVVLVFGPAYQQTGVLLGPALLLFTPLFIGNNLWQTLVAQSRVRDGLICALQGAVVTTLAVWVLTHAFAGLGAIIGTGIGLSTWVVCLLRRAHGVPTGDDGRRVSLALGLSAGALAVYFALAPFIQAITFIGVMSTLATASWLLVFSADERRMLKGIARRKRRHRYRTSTNEPL